MSLFDNVKQVSIGGKTVKKIELVGGGGKSTN